MKRRETVGKLAWDLVENSDHLDHSPEEQMWAQLEDYEDNVLECVESGKKEYADNFYVVVETKKEPKLNNVIRNYFFHRHTCPTPTYDHKVYRYNRADDYLELMWVLPDKDTYFMMLNRVLEIPEEQRELLQYVLDDSDGTLLKICKQLNREIN